MNTVSPHAKHNWMHRIPHLGRLRVDELILPGAHDSGSDKESPNLSLPQEYTQDVSPAKQVEAGIRALDLRVSYYENHPPGDPRRFQLFHLTSSGRNVAVDIIEMLETFYQGILEPNDTQKEIIILDFHEFKNFNELAHEELQTLVTSQLNHRLIPYHHHALTVEELWNNHPWKTVVAAYNRNTSNETFWPGVDHVWSGDNLNTTAQLKLFMDTCANQRKPDDELQSIQCAKYVLPFHVPDDFSEKIDDWFESKDENSYIQNFHIINTDWSLRSKIIYNCAHANLIKAGKK